jgi:hypothetical protein
MELSNDQKAILRLLAQRGAAGYDDLTALMGIDAAEVYERAKTAAAALEAEGIPAPSIPAPGSSGSTSPAPSSQPEPAPKPDPPTPPAAVEAPAPPPAMAAPPAPRSNDPRPPRKTESRPQLSLPQSNGARAALAIVAAVLVAVVVALTLGDGEDSGDTTTTAGESTTGAEETVSASNNPKLTQAVLSPIDGGDAKGVATFGRVKNSLALQVEAEGLEPTEQGDSYTIWLYESPEKMLPLASTVVAEDGRIGAQVEVPTEVLAYLANETFDQLDISLTTDATLKASLAKATKEEKAPIYTGTDVLRGTITGPIIGAADKAKAGE